MISGNYSFVRHPASRGDRDEDTHAPNLAQMATITRRLGRPAIPDGACTSTFLCRRTPACAASGLSESVHAVVLSP